QLIELHGGTLSARSAGVGHGASFTLTLPVAARRRATPVPGPQPDPLEGVRVLVVDDSPDMLEALGVVLRAAGAVVECASSVEAAWPRLLAAVPDLVVSDIAMPREDGLSLARRIRASDALREVAMVALTAGASDLETERAAAAGFDVHVAKPVDFDELLIALRTALLVRLRTV
ncbi:MAG: two-component sensor histidine kinase, partial [Deltaproteobacteria bacterium]|nr:two-component sensor histidine kinase [Deltaproteobacteria bacterium]